MQRESFKKALGRTSFTATESERENPFIIIDTKTQSEYVISENEAERLFGIKGSNSKASLITLPKLLGSATDED